MTGNAANVGAGDAHREASDLADYLSDKTTILPRLIETEEAATQIAHLFLSSNGATFSLHFGSMADKPYLAVSIYQDLEARYSKWWSGKSLSVFKLRAFIASNRQLGEEPRNSIGIWYDIENDRTYLEVTATLSFNDKSDYTEAIRLGRHYNQIGIYDLEERVYLSLGGTGELPADVPPVLGRLPTLQRGAKT